MHFLILSLFLTTERFKKCTQSSFDWVKANLIKIKTALTEVSVWIYWRNIPICAPDINAHNDQGCKGIEHTLLFCAKRLKLSALTIWPRRHIFVRNKTDDLTLLPLLKNYEWVVKARLLIALIQLKFDKIQNNYSTHTLVILAWNWVKKINSCWRNLN